MLTPTSSHATHKRGNSLQHMLTELNRKISEISEIKCMINDTIFEQELQQSNYRQAGCAPDRKSLMVMLEVGDLIKYFNHQFKSSVKDTLQRLHSQNIESTLDIINYYQLEIKKCKNYYQSEIWDLREEIKRQYKVIAMMKQEVEDLMILMKYKDVPQLEPQSNQFTGANNSDDMHKSKQNPVNSRQYTGELEVIDEETERTLQSSQRSQGNMNEQFEKNSYFIKIQEKQEESDYREEVKIDEQRPGWNHCGVKTQNQAKQGRQEDYYEYGDDLTPKEEDKLDPKPANTHLPRDTKNQHSEIQNDLSLQCPSPCRKAEELAMEARRKTKIHTAPSDNKLDHLQSIFFLDDEPEEYFHKTSQIKTMGQKLQFYDSQWDQHNDLRTLQHSHLSAEDEYYPVEEVQQRKNNEDKSKSGISQFSRRGSQESSIKNSMVEVSSRGQISTKKPGSEMNGGKKNAEQEKMLPKSNRIMTQQQTNDYINKKFNKVVAKEQFHSSASVPIFSSSLPLGEVSPNIDSQNGDRQSIQSKPKTRQFLEEFRKTFNKCLKSVQVSKKNSTKLNNSYQKQGKASCESEGSGNLTSGVMTFGKSNPSSNYSSISHKETQFHKENTKQKCEKYAQNEDSSSKSSVRAVDQMLKQLENSNKFVIGNKKLELKYEGDKKNGVRAGHGILYYSNGLCYEGQFKDGYRHGYGTLKFNHIQIYNGDWFHDEIQGQGKIRNCAIINKRKTVYSTQTPLGKWISYSGEFKNSKFEGPGTLYLQGGEKFVGHFQNGYACGEGLVYKKNGDVEQGNWRNNFLVENKKQVF